MTVVLDSSAVLASLWGERGANIVAEVYADAVLSTVNLAEIVGKMMDRGFARDHALDIVAGLECQISAFSQEQSVDAGLLRPLTRHMGLSLGDRACLALARSLGATVLTADRAWADLDLGVAIQVIR